VISSKRHARISRYLSIIEPLRQGQQKITVSGVYRFITPKIKKFSSLKMRNRQFVFTPKIKYELVAERSEAGLQNLQFPYWCVCLTKSEPFLSETDGALRAPNRTLGRAKRKGVGGKEFLPALAFRRRRISYFALRNAPP